MRILGFSSTTPDLRPDVEEFRYPRADTPNATSTLRMLRFTLSSQQEVVDVESFDLTTSLTTFFPWLEYIVRVGWTNDGTHVWAQILDRSQQRLELILIPESQFVRRLAQGSSTLAHSPPSSLPRLSCTLEGRNGQEATRESGALQVIASEQSDSWISIHDILHFLPHTDPTQVDHDWEPCATISR